MIQAIYDLYIYIKSLTGTEFPFFFFFFFLFFFAETQLALQLCTSLVLIAVIWTSRQYSPVEENFFFSTAFYLLQVQSSRQSAEANKFRITDWNSVVKEAQQMAWEY